MQQLSVSSLLRYLKYRLDSDDHLQKIYVSGEISNYHRHFSGHLYFTLKDEHAAIDCVMFKSCAASLTFEPKTGDSVVVYANTSIFESTGRLQLYVQKMSPDGLGDLYARYEALKNRLTAQGIFSAEHKKTWSVTFPEKIGVLVGDHSAAMSDISRCFARRWPLANVDYYPVLVQGSEAPADIIEKLLQADEKGYDAIILARGGGPFEDLFCFNDEKLVMTIYRMKTFLVTGIGHEQDFTLSDFAADLRAATPTAAVEQITPDIRDISLNVEKLSRNLVKAISDRLEEKRMLFDYYSGRLIRYMDILSSFQRNIDHSIETIRNSIRHKCDRNQQIIAYSLSQMASKLDFKLNNSRLLYKRLNTLLEAYSAENVLNRGYSLIFQDGRIVKKKSDLQDREFCVRFADGQIDAIERKQHEQGT